MYRVYRDADWARFHPRQLGPILMGEMAAIFFTGILLCTLHSFWQSPSWTHISKPLRWLTLFVCLLVTTQAALFTADIYSMGIQPINSEPI